MRKKIIHQSAITGMSVKEDSRVTERGLSSSRSQRKVRQILKAHGVNVGTLPVLRAFAGDQIDYVSPYVLFDEFGPVKVEAGSDPLRVDAHPHAGVTPTTYFLKGTGHHKDSLDYDFQIGRGDFMMFSSGRGAIHMEESGRKLYDEGGLYHGFQIWLNTPAKYKLIDPTTSVHREEHMDIIDNDHYWLKVVLGELGKAKSTVDLLSPAFYYHLKLKDNGKIDVPVDPNHNIFIYVIDGEVELEDGNLLKSNEIALFERDGIDVGMFAKCEAEMLVLGGAPLNEPVYSYGPFIMNTQEQIRQCVKNYQSGLMGNPDLVN